MPVIRNVPQDPTDLVIQGEQLRQAAISSGIHSGGSPLQMSALFLNAVEPRANILVEDGEAYIPAHPDFTPYHARLRSPFAGTMISNNAVISTPCGALFPMDIGNHLMDTFTGTTSRWQITGVTRDNAGATLGNCWVAILEAGRIAKGESPLVAETISDGSGNYSVEVALNTAHQGIAYKDGSPDVAGISSNILTPTQV
jgi:hypothetical protein